MGLQESLSQERVSDLALREPVLASPSETVQQAVNRMRRRKLGCVIVIDESRKPVGYFTERMLARLIASKPSAVSEPLEGHMSVACPVLSLSSPVSRVLQAMQRENTRFLCVTDDAGQVVGLTGQKGLMEYIADHFPQHVHVQRVGSPPPREREGA